jgi:hypothetical protein
MQHGIDYKSKMSSKLSLAFVFLGLLLHLVSPQDVETANTESSLFRANSPADDDTKVREMNLHRRYIFNVHAFNHHHLRTMSEWIASP